MARRRRRARRNPGITTTGWVVLGVGIALVGGTIYFMTKPTAATTPTPGATPALTPAQQQAAAAQIVAAQKAIQAAAVAANTPLGV